MTDSPVSKIIAAAAREKLIEFMVQVHGVSPYLAEYHVQEMSDKERKDRLDRYIREAKQAEAKQEELF